ncbi:hypothetical protein ACHAXH_004479 [Discostella pseudostelligera]
MDQIGDETNKCRFADDETVQRLIANDNDPTIAAVRIVLGDDILDEMDHGGQDDNDDDYIDFYDPTYDYISDLCFEARRVGRAIGNNKHLRKLCVSMQSGYHHVLPDFCNELANNRSIEHLAINDCGRNLTNLFDDFFLVLAPFIENNHNLRSIDFGYCSMAERLPSFVSALLQSKTVRLEKLNLDNIALDDEGAAHLLNSLNNFPGLSYLLDLCLKYVRIGRKGCLALFYLLRNPSTKLQRLHLGSNEFDDYCIGNIALALTVNKTVKDFSLRYNPRITPQGWSTFSLYLSNPNCSLETLDLSVENQIGDEGAISLGNAMDSNKSLKLKCPDLTWCKLVTSVGWHGFSIG